MGTNKTRLNKVQWIKKSLTDFFIKNPDGVVSKRKLIANFALKMDSTERTGQEILKTLELTKFVRVDGDDIKRQ